jgi:coenzyme F420-reducing hydrogenase delta subunit
MAEPVVPDVAVNICENCIPEARHLPRQWTQDGVHVLVREVPCSGKTDSQYLLHTLEGVKHGVWTVACPHGECRLSQGNYRAEVRTRTTQKLLEEIGLEPERVEFLISSPEGSFDDLERHVRGAVKRLGVLGTSALQSTRRLTGMGDDDKRNV